MTADPANAKRVERFKALIRATAKRFSCKRDDPRVRRWVALELSAEQVMARMVGGRDFDPGLLLKIQEAQASIFPMASVQVDPLNIQIVRRLHELCRKCGESQPFVCRNCGHEETRDDANTVTKAS
jgi:hypothetical protein